MSFMCLLWPRDCEVLQTLDKWHNIHPSYKHSSLCSVGHRANGRLFLMQIPFFLFCKDLGKENKGPYKKDKVICYNAESLKRFSM